jgi:DNA-binding NarL/FixJ family response regulator
MQQIDPGFNRLASAWSRAEVDGASTQGLVSPLSQAVPSQVHQCAGRAPDPSDSGLATTPRVIVTRGMRRPPAAFDGGALASPRVCERIYRPEPVAVAGFDQLERLCHKQAPRVLLIDICLIRDASAGAVQHLRRRLPATDWILGFDAVLPGESDMAVLHQMRGCIDWAAGTQLLARALDAVLGGELWFPRPVLESLYLSLLEAGQSGSTAPQVNADAAELTSREAEVLALMRRGLTNRQIGERLGVSCNTVKKHLAHVFEKRGLHGRRQELE